MEGVEIDEEDKAVLDLPPGIKKVELDFAGIEPVNISVNKEFVSQKDGQMNIDERTKSIRSSLKRKIYKDVTISENINVVKKRLRLAKENGVIKAYVCDVVSDATRGVKDVQPNSEWTELVPVSDGEIDFLMGQADGVIDDDMLIDEVEIEIEPEVYEGVDVSQYENKYYNNHFSIRPLEEGEVAVNCGENYFVHPLMGEHKIIKMVKYSGNEEVRVNYRFDIENSKLLASSLEHLVEEGDYVLYEYDVEQDEDIIITDIFTGIGIGSGVREVDFKNLKFRYVEIRLSEYDQTKFKKGEFASVETKDRRDGEKTVYFDVKGNLEEPYDFYEDFDDLCNKIGEIGGTEKLLFIIDDSGYFYFGTFTDLMVRPGDNQFNYITSGKIMFVIVDPIGETCFMVPSKKTVTVIKLSLQEFDDLYRFYPSGILDFDMLNEEYDDKIMMTKDIEIRRNGNHEYYANEDYVDGYDKVLVDVDVEPALAESENYNINENKTYDLSELESNYEMYEGMSWNSKINVQVPSNNEKLTNKPITSSGTVNVSSLMSDQTKDGISKDSTLNVDKLKDVEG